jgi:hydrogenase maturation protease
MVSNGGAFDLLAQWEKADIVILIDASAAEGSPGRIRRWTPETDDLPRPPADPSSHALGLAEALRLSAVLGTRPRTLIVYAVEGEDFGHGTVFSPPVAAAVPAVIRRIESDLAAILKEAPNPV